MSLQNLLAKKLVNVLVLLLLWLPTSCQENTILDDQNNFRTPLSEPPQYGTPFAGVPDPRDAIIYQVNMRVFSASRNFQGVIDRLDSIRALGVNVIYLMPIHPVGILKAFNSPYSVRDYLAVNPEFGTLSDLRRLVKEAHNRDMAVILDWVANHTSWDNAWVNNPSWHARNSAGEIIIPRNWTDVAQLNFDNHQMRAAMIRAMKHWVLVANIDGFRADFSDGPPIDFWEQAIDTLRKMPNRELILLAEGTRPESFAAGFDYIFGFNFYWHLKEIFGRGAPVTNLQISNAEESRGAGTMGRVVRYITNHDVNCSDGTPLDLFGGRDGSMVAFVVAAYMKGVPMIYNGQEVGNAHRLSFPFTGRIIDWSRNQDMVEEYKRIIAFRNQSEAIRRGALQKFSSADVGAFTRTLANDTVVVMANFRNREVEFTLPANLVNSNWIDAFTGNPVSVGRSVNLSPFEYIVLKN